MPYPEHLVRPMRAELTRIGVTELTDTNQVDAFFSAASDGTALLVVNSVCGCAAAMARPAVVLAGQVEEQPDFKATVFAGQDLEATARAREHLVGIPASSPFIALFSHGEPVFVLERRHIEGRSASAIATDLVGAYRTHCGSAGTNGQPSAAAGDSAPIEAKDDLPDTFRSIL